MAGSTGKIIVKPSPPRVRRDTRELQPRIAIEDGACLAGEHAASQGHSPSQTKERGRTLSGRVRAASRRTTVSPFGTCLQPPPACDFLITVKVMPGFRCARRTDSQRRACYPKGNREAELVCLGIPRKTARSRDPHSGFWRAGTPLRAEHLRLALMRAIPSVVSPRCLWVEECRREVLCWMRRQPANVRTQPAVAGMART